MNALILKSLNHLYKIFKVYLTLSILGALAVIAYGLLVSKPLIILIPLITVGLLAITIMLWFQAKTLSVNRDIDDKQPPKLPESLMALMLPTRCAASIIGDLNEEFIYLVLKWGRKSAATWYAVQSLSIIIHVNFQHLTSGLAKRFGGTVQKKSS